MTTQQKTIGDFINECTSRGDDIKDCINLYESIHYAEVAKAGARIEPVEQIQVPYLHDAGGQRIEQLELVQLPPLQYEGGEMINPVEQMQMPYIQHTRSPIFEQLDLVAPRNTWTSGDIFRIFLWIILIVAIIYGIYLLYKSK